MAFQTGANNNVTPFNNGNNQGQNDSWKSDRFINVWVPTRDGGRRKLGTFGLKKSKARDAALIERLDSNPDDIEALKAVLELSYESAEGSEDAQFDF